MSFLQRESSKLWFQGSFAHSSSVIKIRDTRGLQKSRMRVSHFWVCLLRNYISMFRRTATREGCKSAGGGHDFDNFNWGRIQSIVPLWKPIVTLAKLIVPIVMGGISDQIVTGCDCVCDGHRQVHHIGLSLGMRQNCSFSQKCLSQKEMPKIFSSSKRGNVLRYWCINYPGSWQSCHPSLGSLGVKLTKVAGGDNWAEMHQKWHKSTQFVQLLPQTEKAQLVTP